MRYIADENGYLLEVSLGGLIVCGEAACQEYTGPVPSDYTNMASWLTYEGDKLYRWYIDADGVLTKNPDAVEPTTQEWVNPPLELDKEYRTTERYLGKVVYAKLVKFGSLPNAGNKTASYYGSGSTAVVDLRAMLSDGCVIIAGYGRDRSHSTKEGLFLDCTLYSVRIYTEGDFSSLTANVLVKYTKD